jgi:FSR family fosmidomycin resistance protein-like MFS transporter
MTTRAAVISDAKFKQFQTANVLMIVGAHAIHDTFSAFVAPLLPLIIDRLSLSLTLAGTLTIFLTLPSILNPLIGYMADRINLRYFIILAPGLTATFMSSMGLMDSYVGLAVVLFATGISVAAFHAPAPAMVARISGNRVGKGMSYFMAGGELGRTLGPLVAVAAVSYLTMDGMFPVAVIGWATSLLLFVRFRSLQVRPEQQTELREILPAAKRLFAPILFIVLTRSFVIVSLGTFLPTYLNMRGASLIIAGGALSLYELAGVGGALASGTLSDRFGRKPILVIVTLLNGLFMFIFLQVDGWLLVPVLLALGFISLASQPVLLATVQDHVPNHRAFGNGIYLALGFIARPVATVIIGALGDGFGLQNAFYFATVIGLLTAPFIWTLPDSGPTSPAPSG